MHSRIHFPEQQNDVVIPALNTQGGDTNSSGVGNGGSGGGGRRRKSRIHSGATKGAVRVSLKPRVDTRDVEPMLAVGHQA